MTTVYPANHFNRFDPSKNYDKHLFIAGRGLQSAELNEIQDDAAARLRGVADVLFRDGDVVRDASVSLNPTTGVAQCAAGAIYLRGAVRGVAPATLTIPVVGVVAIGVRLTETIITALEDVALRDPASGTRNYDERGAERLQVVPSWGWPGDGGTGDFYPVYGVTDGIIDAKDIPPNLDSVTQALARYDRDSAGGSYVVSGLLVTALPDTGITQNYSLSEGRARVYGYGLDLPTARRVTLDAVPDLKLITNEPHLSTTVLAQRINFDRTPGSGITGVSITVQKTVAIVHGVFTGAQDPLPDTSVLSIDSVVQGGTTYVAGTSYNLTAGKVDWSPAGAEPAPGSTYNVTYKYIALVAPTLVDDTGFTVTGAVVNTLILVTYSQKLPRIDRICLNSSGFTVWILGISSEFNPQFPAVPEDMLSIASVYQTWSSTRRVTNDSVRVVPMPQLAAIDRRLDWFAQLIAQQRLESNIHTREGGTKKGLFTDPFLDDSQRDAGSVQTAAIVGGLLMLPMAATVHAMGLDISKPETLAYVSGIALQQTSRTGSMNINPYMAFGLLPGQMVLMPFVDRWTEVQTVWASPITSRLVVDGGNLHDVGILVSTATSAKNALLSTSTKNIENLRSIPVAFSIARFGSGEVLASLKFDGVSLPTGGAVADVNGVINGTFTIPAGLPAGSKLVEAVGAGGTKAKAVFTGQGVIEQSVWQNQTTITEVRVDPLAQTFTLEENTQISGIDLWFTAIPTSNAIVQIRETLTGLPTQVTLAERFLTVGQITAAGASTRATFDRPVSLLANVEYALVVLCNDAVGALAVAELGKFDASVQKWITGQPYTVGVLLSSSNASTWTAHQDRDLAFRILKADFSQVTRTIDLGTVAVVGATDLLLLIHSERSNSVTNVAYTLTLPDLTVLTVDDSQPIHLSAPITGNVHISAKLSGNVNFSPVLFPGAQLIVGNLGASGTYISRAIPAGPSVAIKVIYEAIIPGGATAAVHYKGIDIGDSWVPITTVTTRNVDDGYVEFTHTITGVNETAVQGRLTLAGTAAARPLVRDLRIIVT